MRRYRLGSIILLISVAGCSASLIAQQTDVLISPFISLPTASGTSSLAGLGLTLSGNPGFAIRTAARVALKNSYTGTLGANTWLPPWGADVDAVLALSGRPFGGRNRSPATFVFLGAGASARDTADARLITKNWSYGVGTAVPLGSIIDLFAESRWRMSQFVLPTASPRPTRTKELRFGFSVHFGGASSPVRRGR